MNPFIRLLCFAALVLSAASCSTPTPMQKGMQKQMEASAAQPLGASFSAEQRKSNFQSFYETNRTYVVKHKRKFDLVQWVFTPCSWLCYGFADVTDRIHSRP
jgi:hypothetical protein